VPKAAASRPARQSSRDTCQSGNRLFLGVGDDNAEALSTVADQVNGPAGIGHRHCLPVRLGCVPFSFQIGSPVDANAMIAWIRPLKKARARGACYREESDMRPKMSEMISRRGAFSLLGLAAMAGLAVPATLLAASDAEAQTAGMERRGERRGGRQERRGERRSGRSERRATRRGGTPQQ
jgi:hypothetical protein